MKSHLKKEGGRERKGKGREGGREGKGKGKGKGRERGVAE